MKIPTGTSFASGRRFVASAVGLSRAGPVRPGARGSSSTPSSLGCSGGTVSTTAKSIEKAHPSSGEADALLVSCAAERELAGEPLTPDAGRQEASARARRLNEFRRQFRFAGLTKPIGMALAVIPQVRFGVHGSLFPATKT
jgi:hypothetical protein